MNFFLGNKRKPDLVAHMLEILNTSPEDERRLAERFLRIQKSAQSSVPSHYELYKKEFNGVDLMSRLGYQFNYSYQCRQWRVRKMLYLLKVALVNVYTLVCEHNEISWLDFRILLGYHLCGSSLRKN